MTPAAVARATFDRLPAGVREELRPAARRVRSEVERRTRPRWGNLRRTTPFSRRYGADRGRVIDRVYLDDFYGSWAPAITGAVLEVRDDDFSGRFGSAVTVDLVDIDPRNEQATVVADLATPGSLPTATYDCVLMPQTLQYVDDIGAAIANAWQALRPAGTLLVSVPTITRVDPAAPDVDRWRLHPLGLRTLLDAHCPGGDVDVRGYGNLLTSMAFLLGLAAEELTAGELRAYDPAFAMLACGAVQRSGAIT